MPAIEPSSLFFSFTDRPELDNITLHVGDGERTCLIDPNGCSKSTLLDAVPVHDGVSDERRSLRRVRRL